MKKWIFGLGAFALAFAMLVTPMDSKVQAEEAATVSAGDATVSGGNAGTTKTKLATPTSLIWSDSWDASWNTVENANGAYRVVIYKDGESIHSIHYSTSTQVKETMSYEWSRNIEESGVYKFTVQALNDYDPDNFADSEVSEFSAEKVYVRPETQLKTTVGYWDNTQEGIFKVPVVEGASKYAIELYYTAEGEEEDHKVTSYVETYSVENGVLTRDYNKYFQRYGAGKYRIKVRALSADVDTIANGDLGEFSGYYDTTITAANVNSALTETIANASNATQAKQNIVANVAQANLSTAMQTDASVRETIKQLEQQYAQENGITVTPPAVSEAASEYVKADEISLIGAGLNGNKGEEVKLEVSVPEKKEEVNSQYYANSVQLDIQLKSGSNSIHELDVPITITMKIPTGIDVERLVILHYHVDGTFENVTPMVNGDGTITFTVTEFSTFVFAEEKTDNNGGNNGGNNGNVADDSKDDEEEEPEEATPAKDNVPKTGDRLPIALPLTAAVCLAGAAVVLRKKEN